MESTKNKGFEYKLKNMDVFKINPKLRITPDNVGYHATNTMIAHNSSPRSYMYSLHASQAISLKYGEESIIQSGIEDQLSESVYKKDIKKDAKVINVIDRYRSLGLGIDKRVEKKIIVEYLDTDGGIPVIDIISLPRHFSLGQEFGFTYKFSKDVENIIPGTFLEKGKVLADAPTVKDNGGYATGININMATMDIPGCVEEDGIEISESLHRKFEYDVYITYDVSYGKDQIPVNLYGTLDNYKPFPEIGEKVHDSSLLMALRTLPPVRKGNDIPTGSEDLALSMFSNSAMLDYNYKFDDCVYTKYPGETINDLDGEAIDSGVVVDIVAYKGQKEPKGMVTGNEYTERYVDAYINYCKDIINMYDDIKSRYGENHELKPELSNEIKMAKLIANEQNYKIKYNFRSEPLDTYRLEFTIKYTVRPRIGAKMTDKHGAKGIIVGVRPDHKMPITENGIRAEMIMDPSSLPSRLNVGREYEKHLNTISRRCREHIVAYLNNKTVDAYIQDYESLYNNDILFEKDLLKARNMVLTDQQVHDVFAIITELTSYLDNEQYHIYSRCSDLEEQREVCEDAIHNEVFIYNKVSPEKPIYKVFAEIEHSKFKPHTSNILIPKMDEDMESLDDKYEITNDDSINIGPLYVMLLGKTPDKFLSSASPSTNHYQLPITASSKDKLKKPWSNSATKTMGETEIRLYTLFTSVKAVAEMKDRGNSLPTHKEVYTKFLTADKPTNIDSAIDRNKTPFGNDSALRMFNDVFNCAGVALASVPDKDLTKNDKIFEEYKNDGQ